MTEKVKPHASMGELLIKDGLLTSEELNQALTEQKKTGGRLGYHLLRLGFLNVDKLGRFLKDYVGLIPFDLDRMVTSLDVIEKIPTSIAHFYQVVPIELNGDTLTLAISDLDNPNIIPALEELTGFKIDPIVCPREVVSTAIEKFYGLDRDPGVIRAICGDNTFIILNDVIKIRPIHWSLLKRDAPATDTMRALIAEAIRERVRTVLLLPSSEGLQVQFVQRGKKRDMYRIEKQKQGDIDRLLVNLASLYHHRNEGRIKIQVGKRFLNLHVMALRTLQGNRYIMTLLDEKVAEQDLQTILKGMDRTSRTALLSSLEKERGCIVLAGADSAGLKSLYYAILSKKRESNGDIISVEENIWINMKNINQVEVSTGDGDLSDYILSSLKQLPSTIAISPVKDRRTSELAFLGAPNAYVVSVLHQRDTMNTLIWLYKNNLKSPIKAGLFLGILGIASFYELCPKCKIPFDFENPVTHRIHKLYTRRGCDDCTDIETRQSIVVVEYLPPVKEIIEFMEGNINIDSLMKEATRYGFKPIWEQALHLSERGAIDGEEIRPYLPQKR